MLATLATTAVGCGPAYCTFRGTINDPASRTMRRAMLKKGMGDFCQQLLERNAPLRLSPDSPVIGRFYPQQCVSPEGDDLYVNVNGFGYGYTNVSKKVTFNVSASALYKYDFIVTEGDRCDVYAYFRTSRVDAQNFASHRIEGQAANALNAFTSMGDSFGKQLVSKKLSEGISGLVMDVKSGRGAFMKTRERSRELAESIVKVGTANGLRVSALVTAMDAPLGRYVGNALEVIESVETLKGNGPPDLTELSVKLAARMVELAGIATGANAEAKVRTALSSGAGLDVFRACIAQQGGDPKVIDDYSRLPSTGEQKQMGCVWEERGYVTSIDAEKVGIAVRMLGGGRNRAEDGIDHAVGVVIRAKPGEPVGPGLLMYEVHYRDSDTLHLAAKLLDMRSPSATRRRPRSR